MSDAHEQTLAPSGAAGTRALTPVEMAEQLAGALRAAGGDLLYGVPGGGANLDMIGAAQAAGCRFVLTHTETAATIMAGVTAELTGYPSASVMTRGPGAASAVNGAAQALLDRQPVVIITDCVSTADRHRISHQRLDQGAMLGATTKASLSLGPRNTVATVREILALVTSGRPGPVHVDVDPTLTASWPVLAHPHWPGSDVAFLEAARRALRDAHRPVVIVGVGAVATPQHRRSATVASLRRFVDGTNIPVLTTYKGRGLIADSSDCAAGIATGATIEAGVLNGADLIIGIGLDPVELIPGPWPYPVPVVLLGSWGIDDSEFFGDRVVAEAVGDLEAMLGDLADDVSSDWTVGAGSEFKIEAQRRLLDAIPASPVGLTPQQVVTVAREIAPVGTIATVDAGAHMLVAVPLWEVEEPGELLISSGLATMGFALPAAAAAALVHPERHVVCFTGDGGLGMVLAELETLARLRLRVVVVVFNDATLSLIAIKQRPEGHGGEGAVHYAPTDFAAIAAAYGLASLRVDDAAHYRLALRQALGNPGPTLLDVAVDPSAYPAVIDVIRGSNRPSMSE